MIERILVTFTVTALTSTSLAAEPTLPEEDASPRATRDKAIAAFTKDCHATLTAVAWSYGEEETVPECKALVIDQNCNPDTFGCIADLESCKVACQPVCLRCQDTCATSCDDCKSACQPDDKACVRACAEARADCRGRCMKGLDDCQGAVCDAKETACYAEGTKRAKACDAEACGAWHACVSAEDDWEKAEARCEPHLKKLGGFCENICRLEGGIPVGDEDATPPPPLDGRALAKACTAEASCPPDYAEVAPYLASFCTGTTNDASLSRLEIDVAEKTVSKRALSLVFNAYGAMYGYQFKQEKWMNGFFYGAGGAWLPPACRAKMKSVASAKVMPLHLTKLRDRVKRIWNAAK